MNKKSFKPLIGICTITFTILMFTLSKTLPLNEILYSTGYYETKINLFNTSDIHGYMLNENESKQLINLGQSKTPMGLVGIDSLVQKHLKNETYDGYLFLDCGDLIHGTNIANIEEGAGIVKVANKMNYTATVPGNHDFNFGINRLLNLKNELEFPILSANVYKDNKPYFQEYIIKSINNTKIGIFGLTLKYSLDHAPGDNTTNLEIRNPIEEGIRLVEKLKSQCDIVILISHLGRDTDLEIINRIPDINLILSGHYHHESTKPELINNTYIVSAGAYSYFLGIGTLYIKNNKIADFQWKLHKESVSDFENNEIISIANKYNEIAKKEASITIAKTDFKLDGNLLDVRSKETNLGNLITDAMKDYAHSDFALMNGGGIRESIPLGEISFPVIERVLPFNNSIITVEMTGKTLKEIIERGLRNVSAPRGNGAFIHVAGLHYEYLADRMAGQRLNKIYTESNQKIDEASIYKVAVNDFLYYGGDGYTEFINSKVLEKGPLLKNVLAEYLKNGNKIKKNTEQRIIRK